MLIKKPSILLATYGSLQNFSTNFTGSSTSLKRKRESTRRRTSCQQQCKSYATISGDDAQHHEHHDHPQYSWPKPPQGQPHPTPYQIFQMTDSATYTKARFYELVKVYHPDKNASPDDRISRAVKMERYRMIVAAHNILSDPTKRSAYDRFGAGWNGKAEVGGRETWYQASPYHKPGPFSHTFTSLYPVAGLLAFTYVQQVYVGQAARRLGVAQKLMAEIARAAKAKGSTRIEWSTSRENIAARALYEELGAKGSDKVYYVLEGKTFDKLTAQEQ